MFQLPYFLRRLLSTLTYSVPGIGHARGRALDAVYRAVLQARPPARLAWAALCTAWACMAGRPAGMALAGLLHDTLRAACARPSRSLRTFLQLCLLAEKQGMGRRLKHAGSPTVCACGAWECCIMDRRGRREGWRDAWSPACSPYRVPTKDCTR